MARIALYVIAVAGVTYLVLDRLTGLSLGRVVMASLSVIVAVILWTGFVWWAGDRLGSERQRSGSKRENDQ